MLFKIGTIDGMSSSVFVSNVVDKRSAPRKVFQRRGILMLDQVHALSIKTLDISTDGIGIIASNPLPMDCECTLMVMLGLGEDAIQLMVKGKVVYCILVGTQGFRIGLEYTAVDAANRMQIDRIIGTAFS
jgi:hypothetical protein